MAGNFLKKWVRDAVSEEIEAFVKVGEQVPTPEDIQSTTGEGWESLMELPGVGNIGLGSFNLFYNKFINQQWKSERDKIKGYREMALMTEVADVIEDATNESTQENMDGKLLNLQINDPILSKNENIVKNIEREFNYLFVELLDDFQDFLWDAFRTYMTDGRFYYERIIDTRKPERGIIGLKKLPSETMDYFYEPRSGEVLAFMQYLTDQPTAINNLEEARAKDGKELVLFNTNQIGFVNYGVYGINKHDIYGYLEKARVPYNQLKLLETSVVIYRLIRAPERLVFRIDTGNMPKDKALKYVEKVKQKLSKKQTYNPETGALTNEPEVFSMLENYYLPQSADGRGSQIDSVGGNAAGFAELDDIYYFARKMYRALKYPASRVNAEEQKSQGDILFGGGSTGEISRDEIKWSKFLERQQKKFCREFENLFLLHLEFKGLKKQYDLDHKKIKIFMNPPSNYKEQMEQNFLETRFNNYSTLADRAEMSKYYLMKKYLNWSDDEIDANVAGQKKDKELGFTEDEEGGMGGYSDKRLKRNIIYL
jgi:hypothetical protein